MVWKNHDIFVDDNPKLKMFAQKYLPVAYSENHLATDDRMTTPVMELCLIINKKIYSKTDSSALFLFFFFLVFMNSFKIYVSILVRLRQGF